MQFKRYISAAFVCTSLAFTGCASTSTDTNQPSQTASKAVKMKPKRPKSVKGCMKRTKLTDVQFMGGDGAANGYRKWTGSTSDGDLVRITQLESKSAARKAVKAATEAQGVAGGRYSVISEFGTQNTINPLAHCLRRVK
jgi:hypothetical protein